MCQAIGNDADNWEAGRGGRVRWLAILFHSLRADDVGEVTHDESRPDESTSRSSCNYSPVIGLDVIFDFR
jgi:hypothetical protein